MIDDGLFNRFPRPDVILAQHVMPTPAGTIGTRAGVITSAGDTIDIRLFGRGAHGSMPQASIDPVVMAAATVLRLQTIVAREVAPAEAGGRHSRGAAGRNEGERHPRRGRHQTQRAHVRRRRPHARARRDQRIVHGEAAASGAPAHRRSPRSTATTSSRTTRSRPNA